MNNDTFAVGDKVVCPSEFGSKVLVVAEVVPIPSKYEQDLALHTQWVIVENDGVRQLSKSGYYFHKIAEIKEVDSE